MPLNKDQIEVLDKFIERHLDAIRARHFHSKAKKLEAFQSVLEENTAAPDIETVDSQDAKSQPNARINAAAADDPLYQRIEEERRANEARVIDDLRNDGNIDGAVPNAEVASVSRANEEKDPIRALRQLFTQKEVKDHLIARLQHEIQKLKTPDYLEQVEEAMWEHKREEVFKKLFPKPDARENKKSMPDRVRLFHANPDEFKKLGAYYSYFPDDFFDLDENRKAQLGPYLPKIKEMNIATDVVKPFVERALLEMKEFPEMHQRLLQAIKKAGNDPILKNFISQLQTALSIIAHHLKLGEELRRGEIVEIIKSFVAMLVENKNFFEDGFNVIHQENFYKQTLRVDGLYVSLTNLVVLQPKESQAMQTLEPIIVNFRGLAAFHDPGVLMRVAASLPAIACYDQLKESFILKVPAEHAQLQIDLIESLSIQKRLQLCQDIFDNIRNDKASWLTSWRILYITMRSLIQADQSPVAKTGVDQGDVKVVAAPVRTTDAKSEMKTSVPDATFIAVISDKLYDLMKPGGLMRTCNAGRELSTHPFSLLAVEADFCGLRRCFAITQPHNDIHYMLKLTELLPDLEKAKEIRKKIFIYDIAWHESRFQDTLPEIALSLLRSVSQEERDELFELEFRADAKISMEDRLHLLIYAHDEKLSSDKTKKLCQSLIARLVSEQEVHECFPKFVPDLEKISFPFSAIQKDRVASSVQRDLDEPRFIGMDDNAQSHLADRIIFVYRFCSPQNQRGLTETLREFHTKKYLQIDSSGLDVLRDVLNKAKVKLQEKIEHLPESSRDKTNLVEISNNLSSFSFMKTRDQKRRASFDDLPPPAEGVILDEKQGDAKSQPPKNPSDEECMWPIKYFLDCIDNGVHSSVSVEENYNYDIRSNVFFQELAGKNKLLNKLKEMISPNSMSHPLSDQVIALIMLTSFDKDPSSQKFYRKTRNNLCEALIKDTGNREKNINFRHYMLLKHLAVDWTPAEKRYFTILIKRGILNEGPLRYFDSSSCFCFHTFLIHMDRRPRADMLRNVGHIPNDLTQSIIRSCKPL